MDSQIHFDISSSCFPSSTSKIRTWRELLILDVYGCSENSGVFPPNHPFVHRVFHYFHHPFWGTPLFGNTPKWSFLVGKPTFSRKNPWLLGKPTILGNPHVSSTQLSPNTRAGSSSQRSSQMGKPSDASTRCFHEDTYRGIRGFAGGFSNVYIY